MPTYLSPGVYVEEVPAGTRPISGVGTAVAAFVGFAEQGPVNEPTLVTNWTQYVTAFGEITENFALAKAVYGYFNNGGGRAYIVRLPYDSSGGATAQPVAQLSTKGDNSVPAFTVKAINAASTDLSVQVAAATGDDAQPDTFDVNILQGGKGLCPHAAFADDSADTELPEDISLERLFPSTRRGTRGIHGPGITLLQCDRTAMVDRGAIEVHG